MSIVQIRGGPSLWAGAAPAHIPCLVVSLPLRALPFPPRSLPRGDRDPHTQYRPISTNFNSFILFDRVTSAWPWCPENGSWQRRLLTEWNFCRLESNYLKTPLIPEQKPLIVEFSVTRSVKLPPRHLVCRSTKEFIVWRCAALRFHKSSQRPTVCVGRAPAVTDREGIASKLSIWSEERLFAGGQAAQSACPRVDGWANTRLTGLNNSSKGLAASPLGFYLQWYISLVLR